VIKLANDAFNPVPLNAANAADGRRTRLKGHFCDYDDPVLNLHQIKDVANAFQGRRSRLARMRINMSIRRKHPKMQRFA
jgi:hypothetical protein